MSSVLTFASSVLQLQTYTHTFTHRYTHIIHCTSSVEGDYTYVCVCVCVEQGGGVLPECSPVPSVLGGETLVLLAGLKWSPMPLRNPFRLKLLFFLAVSALELPPHAEEERLKRKHEIVNANFLSHATQRVRLSSLFWRRIKVSKRLSGKLRRYFGTYCFLQYISNCRYCRYCH